MFVKPYCLIPGSFPNLLVYLPRKQGVKKAQGYYALRGNCYTLGFGRRVRLDRAGRSSANFTGNGVNRDLTPTSTL